MMDRKQRFDAEHKIDHRNNVLSLDTRSIYSVINQCYFNSKIQGVLILFPIP